MTQSHLQTVINIFKSVKLPFLEDYAPYIYMCDNIYMF